jgi:predicted MFS family arabinose efflux permease
MDQEHERLSVAQGIQLCRLRDESARPWSYVAVAIASFVLIAAATVPTPLYQLYQENFHFSEFTLTMIFGIYAFGVIPALLVFGPLGDIICRRRVLMVAIGMAGAGIALLAAARGVLWLLAGRLLVGIAVGATQGNASAALVEMQPREDRRRAGIMMTVCTAGGAASGTLVSGIIAQYLPDPLLLAYIMELAMLAAAFVLVATIKEAASPVLSFVSFHHPRVSRNIFVGFMAASLAGGLIWSIAGLFLALVPSYVSNLLHVRNLAAGGALVALMLGSSIVIQLIMINSSNFRLQMMGLGVAVAGITAVVAAWHLSSFLLMIAGSISSGAAIGMGYLGSISEINRLAAPQERGRVNSLYFVVVVYLFFSIPTIALGFAASHLGLYAAVFGFAAVIILLAISLMVWLAIRQRSAV